MTNINTYLLELSEKLKFSSDMKEKIDASIEYFKQKFWGHFQDRLNDVIVFGSYSRGTIISKDDLADVDIVAIYKSKEFQPDTYLKQIRNFCENIYPRTKIYQDHPTIVIDMEQIKFEIVPSYFISTDIVKIPAPHNREIKWVNTNPSLLINKVVNKDKNNKNLIIPVIRILKYWNILNKRPFSSFQIENAIISKLFNCSTLKEYYVSSISAIEEIANNEIQKKAIMNLKNKQKRLRILESNDLHEYIEQEFSSFLPIP